jgi:serine/threonine-protein kinase
MKTGEIQGAFETILRPGQIVGERYRIDSLIGKGGMAAVWAGVNERTGKRVALKVILRSFASSGEAAELFRREALAASRVNHPNVVNVFDVIDHEGMTCIVMEMLDGEPFGNYLARKGALSVEEAAALLLPAMRGVAAANAQGVVHRDLKPQNIFLCVGPDGRLVTTKVLDFGISVMMEKAFDSSAATVQLNTLGTPAYMSPEHIAGAPDIDARADVYGFGVLFFEALTGQPPFAGEPGPALLMRILSESPPRLNQMRPDLSPAVVRIIECAMAKEANDRFPTLDHFIGAVEDHLLPSSSLPRTLTPLAGVPLFTMRESSSGVADSVVQVIRRAEPSGLHEINETRALYTLPRASEDVEAVLSRKSVAAEDSTPDDSSAVSTNTMLVSLGSSVGRDVRHFLAKRTVIIALFVAVLALVIWIAVPRPTSFRASPKESTPNVSARANAIVQPLPAKATESVVVPAPLAAPGEVAGRADVEAKGEANPAPPLASDLPPQRAPQAPAKVSAAHAPRAQAEEHRARKSVTSPSALPSSSPPASAQYAAPRAGKLTPDDF